MCIAQTREIGAAAHTISQSRHIICMFIMCVLVCALALARNIASRLYGMQAEVHTCRGALYVCAHKH